MDKERLILSFMLGKQLECVQFSSVQFVLNCTDRGGLVCLITQMGFHPAVHWPLLSELEHKLSEEFSR